MKPFIGHWSAIHVYSVVGVDDEAHCEQLDSFSVGFRRIEFLAIPGVGGSAERPSNMRGSTTTNVMM